MWKLLQANLLFAATLIFSYFTSTNNSNVAPTPEHSFYNTEFVKYSFIAPEKLNLLVQFEWTVYTYIKRIYDSCSNNQTQRESKDEFGICMTRIKMYLDDFQKYILNAITRLESSSEKWADKIVSWNPSLAYKVILLFQKYSQIWDELKRTDDKLMMKIASSLHKINIRPYVSETDLNAALYGILHVQHSFNLTVQDISNGIVNEMNTHIIFNAEDCFRIGMYSVSINYFTIGIHWLEHALHLAQDASDKTLVEEVDDALLTAQVLKNHLDFKQWRVCNGQVQPTHKEQSELFCWYEHEIHPSYKIGPIKAEFYSMFPKPEVVQYYDIISEEVIHLIKNRTKLKSEKAIRGTNLVKERFGGYLFYNTTTAQNLLRLVNRLTGLETLNHKVAFPLSIFLYPTGTEKERHTDRGNDAIITFMFYLTDVGKGGETAFGTAGVKVIPRKGSATIWYNRLIDGSLDESTDHGSCPVGFGEKWVALSHISFHDQHHLQCQRNPKTRFEILVNGKSKRNPLC